ncbi:MAG: transposase [Candidatus Cloacimonadota bacterium]|nr:transposase [Candidatus Cloacimonadota bacterium]
MHRKNKEHLQGNLFYDFPQTMSEFIDMVKETKEYSFYENIFCEIDESIFEPLYCKNNGRPNAPINTMVCALSLKEEHEWSYSEMFSEIKYNLAVRTALGLFSFYGMPFSESTIFQFQNLIYNYELKTGIKLFEKAFDNLVHKHIKKYKIKTDIIRLDSFMIDSNIRKYGRLQFLIEIIKRLYRVLETRDKKRFKKIFKPYNHLTSEHYIYELKSGKIPSELNKIADIYYLLKVNLSPSNYESKQSYKNFIRVFDEHFSLEDKKIRVKIQSEIGSDTLQSPDDTDATYRKKRKVSYRGQSGNVVETANKENDINLILDLCAFPNNVDDSTILNERLDIIKEKTEDLKEAHFDGGFGSEDNDKKMKKLEIKPVQTAIKGRKAEVVIDIKKDEESEEFEVSCPNNQTVKAERTPKRFKACFNKEICKSCPFSDKCPTTVRKNYRVYYFSSEDFLKRKRHANLRHIPPDRRNLRANVEATVREFTRHMQGHKLKVRGAFKAELYLFSVGIMVNFGRIYRYLKKKGENGGLSFIFNFNPLILCQILLKIKQNLLKIDSLFQIQTTYPYYASN